MSLWLLTSVALAVRPTGGGVFSFDATDVVETYDEPTGRVRVHYSVSGPNQARLEDTDADGLPDYVVQAGSVAAEALALFEANGFRPPVPESEFGLEALGGSPALDLYLVDFARQADGKFDVDSCQGDPVHCVGFMVVENDFSGYSYPTPLDGLRVVVPHELFHAVQVAYSGELEVWAAEGTATWAEHLFDPAVRDYLRLVNAYLEEPTRALGDPPVGPGSGWSYGNALWFDFLATRHDSDLIVQSLEAWEADPDNLVEGMLDALVARGDTVSDAWITFSTWNLATGLRSGGLSQGGYDYADLLVEVPLEVAGEFIEDDTRFYPLATTYARVNHKGGELWFGLEEAAPGVWFSVHPTLDGKKDAPVLDAVASFWGDHAGPGSLGELPAGQYYLWGAQPEYSDSSIKVRWCAGAEAEVNACMGVTGQQDPPDVEDPANKGCGCAVPPSGMPGAGLVLLPLGLALYRRRLAISSRDLKPA